VARGTTIAFARQALRNAAGDRWVRESARSEFALRLNQLADLLAAGAVARASARGESTAVTTRDVRAAQDELLEAQDLAREIREALDQALDMVKRVERKSVRARARRRRG
jgi:hypothetical protein